MAMQYSNNFPLTERKCYSYKVAQLRGANLQSLDRIKSLQHIVDKKVSQIEAQNNAKH